MAELRESGESMQFLKAIEHANARLTILPKVGSSVAFFIVSLALACSIAFRNCILSPDSLSSAMRMSIQVQCMGVGSSLTIKIYMYYVIKINFITEDTKIFFYIEKQLKT
jgi:hypothetical protein